MSKRRKLAYVFAMLGLALAAVIFAFLEITNYDIMPPTLRGAILILCPPAVLSVAFLDIQPHSVEIAIGWLIIGVINAAWYRAIGVLIGKRLFEIR